MVEKHGAVNRSGDPRTAAVIPETRPKAGTPEWESRMAAMREGLRKRYEYEIRTRFQGYEEESAAMFYSSVLSDGPVAFVDRVVIKAPVSRLPLVPDYWQMFRTRRKGRDDEFYLDKERRVPGFVVHIGGTKAGQHLYVTRPVIRLRRPILWVFVTGLVGLAERSVLRLGTTPESRERRAYDLLRRAFSVSELELRVDLNRRAGAKLMDVLGEYRDEKDNFELSCWEHRHVAGHKLKLYDKSVPVVRVEAVLYSKFFAGLPPSAVLSTPRVTFARWWPLAVEKIKEVARYGHKPKLSHLLEAVADWVPLVDRVRKLGVESVAGEMIWEGKSEDLF